ncbi:Rossmann-fold NAD(P)-binding domain-containing protein [Legionella septentrionalis]|uniref:ornithine cyclodeaminase family protein n=1 Tax=Legionella septentrionalis TaxID=2498109 RepID=UPI000F8CF952|nr:ornithine cyclodeaminase family protein [Legionella septentrionalis]RUR12865.1 ornithine cyclodeaminase family protein [Legionella septentrionalis]
MRIINLHEIKNILKSVDIMTAIEEGFVNYSKGNCVVPPVGELLFKTPPGEVHIKSGYIRGDDYYVIKIASGFYDNQAFNLSSNNGLMLLFSQKTGELLTILLDEGYLTNIRTGIAGAIAAKYLAPGTVNCIGILGTGTQARLQLSFLRSIMPCSNVLAFGRNYRNLLHLQEDMQKEGFNVQITQVMEKLTAICNLIVTTTPSTLPILFAKNIKPGTHITAIGADTSDKQELDVSIFSVADIVVVDSVAQCVERGNTAHAVRKKIIRAENLVELGQIISGESVGRTNDTQITIADLTGLAIQDLQIAKKINEACLA